MSHPKQESEYTARLRAMAEPLIRAAKYDLAKTGRVTPMLVFEHGDKIALVPLPDKIAAALDSGEGKDALFDGVRRVVTSLKCTGVAILTDAWMRETTPAGLLMGHREWLALYEKLGPEELEKRGLLASAETIIVNAQTPERVLILSQSYTRGDRSITFGPAEEIEGPQDQFEGRQKMFGDTSDPKLHLHRDSSLGNKKKAKPS